MRDLQKDLEINEPNVMPYNNSDEPPWKLQSNLICTDEIGKTKNQYNKEITKLLFEEQIKTSQNDAIHVYTDESKSDEGVGGACVIGNKKQAF